jgi:hypothetical protein
VFSSPDSNYLLAYSRPVSLSCFPPPCNHQRKFNGGMQPWNLTRLWKLQLSFVGMLLGSWLKPPPAQQAIAARVVHVAKDCTLQNGTLVVPDLEGSGIKFQSYTGLESQKRSLIDPWPPTKQRDARLNVGSGDRYLTALSREVPT